MSGWWLCIPLVRSNRTMKMFHIIHFHEYRIERFIVRFQIDMDFTWLYAWCMHSLRTWGYGFYLWEINFMYDNLANDKVYTRKWFDQTNFHAWIFTWSLIFQMQRIITCYLLFVTWYFLLQKFKWFFEVFMNIRNVI